MNKCHFLGRATGIHYTEKDADNPSCIMFMLEVEEFRKSTTGKKVRDFNYLDMEAWDSAAYALNQYVEEGSEVAIEAIARGDGEATWFRITNFKILSKDIQ
jgi:single-stranded DNA-binding protein